MFNIGTQELLVILLVVLLLFGARRVPEVSRALGKGMADLREALSGVERELKGDAPRSRIGSASAGPIPAGPAAAASGPGSPGPSGAGSGPPEILAENRSDREGDLTG
jgi:sec-independent protein translocase protein TatA